MSYGAATATVPAGYAMTITGTLPLRVTCPGGTTSMTATLAGTVAVAAP